MVKVKFTAKKRRATFVAFALLFVALFALCSVAAISVRAKKLPLDYFSFCVDNGFVFSSFNVVEAGESLTFDGTYDDFVTLSETLAQVKTEVMPSANTQSVCGFSVFCGKGVWTDGKYVNVQIAYSNGKITVGSPYIFSGF